MPDQDTMTAELVPQEPAPLTLRLTAAEIRAEVNLIQEVLKAVMKKDVHYGIIPGTPKPTLYKPGAETILATFKLDPEPLVEDLSSADEQRIRVRIRLTNQITTKEVGWGVGEASSMETKYKWIKPVCEEEFNETPEDRRRKKWKRGREGKVYQEMQIRANIPDLYNTILKMAKKRALVDAALTATHASDVFDQDIEDLPEELRKNLMDRPARPPMPQPNRAQNPPPPVTTPAASPKQETSAPDPDAYYDQDPPEEPAAPRPAAAPVQRRMIDLTGARKMTSKFDAPCKLCAKMMTKGDPMVYIPDGPDKGGYHVGCAQG